jgi:hypothetical protein
VSTRCLVGALNADDPDTVSVRYVHSDGYPDYMLYTLDQIWSTTCARDTAKLVEALLAHQWSYLGADVTADTAASFTGEQPVPGVGMVSEFDADSHIEHIALHARFDHVSWVYLIDPTHHTVRVYDPDNLTTPLNVHHLPVMPAPAEKPPSGAPQAPDLLAGVRVAATAAGRRIADAWAQDTLADQPTEQATAAARRVLASDPAALQTLLDAALTAEAENTGPAGLAGMIASPGWSRLTPARQAEVLDTWRDAERTAAVDRIVVRCRMVLRPTGDGGDLSHLHPDRLRIGGVGVFALDLGWTPGPDGEMRMPLAFVGTLVNTWNGFAVFTCSRTVAEAIVADQHLHRERRHAELVEQGRSPDDADQVVDGELARMRLDGDAVVVDETAVCGDPDAVTRIEPDPDGQYVVMGGSWCWEAVDPADCDRIVGDLPAPGAQQQFVQLPHTWLRVPHDRLRVTDLQPVPTKKPGTSIVTLALDGVPAAEARSGVGGSHMFTLSAAFGRNDWTGYLAGCRHHGRPASAAQVLDALVTEYQVDQAVRQAEAGGGVLTRLLDADGAILRLHPVWPAPTGHSARMQLGQRLRLQDPHPQGHLWQLWTGASWQHLASVTGFHTVADAPARPPTAGQVFAFVIAESLLERLGRAELVRHAAGEGIPLDPQMTDDEIRALLRAAHRERGRQNGLPVDDLPTLSAADGLELGRIAAGGTPSADRPAAPPTPSDPDQPAAP